MRVIQTNEQFIHCNTLLMAVLEINNTDTTSLLLLSVVWSELMLAVCSLSLSGACQVDVAIFTSSRRAAVQSAPPCCRQAEIERTRSSSTVLSQGCLGLPKPVFHRTQNVHLKSARVVLTGIGMTETSEERQATSMDSVRQEWLSSARLVPGTAVVSRRRCR